MSLISNSLRATVVLILYGPLVAAATPRLEVRAWNDEVRPPVLEQDSSRHAGSAYPPDDIADSLRTSVPVFYSKKQPQIDGHLDDWPLVRWMDIRGSGAVERGQWQGPSDLACRFALLWSTEGLLLGGTLLDDELRDVADNQGSEVETITLMVGSSSPLVQRYWRGSERVFRLRSDSSLRAWTRFRNRRDVPFDATLLGADSGVHEQRKATEADQLDFEIFVPWDQLFPALPHARSGLLVNVIVEDVDTNSRKTLAWSTTLVDAGPQRSWSRMSFKGGPADGTWLVSLATRALEPGQACEWSVVRWSDTPSTTTFQARYRSAMGSSEPVRIAWNTDPAIVRLHDLPDPTWPWLEARRCTTEIGVTGEEPWRVAELRHVPSAEAFNAGLSQLMPDVPGESRVFPQREDVVVRLQRASRVAAEQGSWGERIYHDTGVLISRESRWTRLEEDLGEVDLLRELLLGGAKAEAARRRFEARWPQRTPGGHPVGVPVLRGIYSSIDQTVQPYALYISRSAALAKGSPLVVALHDYSKNELSLFEETSLAHHIEGLGWIAVCPYGRGDTGYQLAGERDVLDVIEKVEDELSVDARRLYVTGFSMGGMGAWLLSLRHPDLFAAASIVSAFGDMDQQGMFQVLGYHPNELFFFETLNPVRLVRPDLDTAYRIVHAEQDAVISVMHARIMSDRLKQYGVRHEMQLLPGADHSMQLFDAELPRSLDFFSKHRRQEKGYRNAAWFTGAGGPIATVFARDPFVVVYGSRELPATAPLVGAERRAGKSLTGPEADLRTANQFAQEWQAIFSGMPRVVADTALTEEMFASHNLVLVGDPRTNRILARTAADLPVLYGNDSFEVDGRVFGFDAQGIFYATANPEVPGRTLVVLSAMGERLGGFSKSLLKLGADYVVTDDEHRVLAMGHFKSLLGVAPRPRRTPDSRF